MGAIGVSYRDSKVCLYIRTKTWDYKVALDQDNRWFVQRQGIGVDCAGWKDFEEKKIPKSVLVLVVNWWQIAKTQKDMTLFKRD